MSASIVTTLPLLNPFCFWRAEHLSATSASFSFLRARRTTFEPQREKSCAVAAPIPLDAPEIRTGVSSNRSHSTSLPVLPSRREVLKTPAELLL